MGRNISTYRSRRRPRLARAIGLLAVLIVMIAIAPAASAMSPVPEIDTIALTSDEVEAGAPRDIDIEEKRLEILRNEYNWWDLWSVPANPAPAPEQDVDALFRHMETYPALYSQADIGIEPGSDGSNTVSDYKAPASSATTERNVHAPLGEGFFSGVPAPNRGTSRSLDRADKLNGLAAAPASENDDSVTVIEDFKFLEENVDFGSVTPNLSRPGEGVNDFRFIDNFRFIEQNTQLPLREKLRDNLPHDRTGLNELDY
jgi:hypothetical protein